MARRFLHQYSSYSPTVPVNGSVIEAIGQKVSRSDLDKDLPFGDRIDKKLNTVRSLPRERAILLASFAIAATILCATALPASPEILVQAAASEIMTLGKVVAGWSLVSRFVLTKNDVSSKGERDAEELRDNHIFDLNSEATFRYTPRQKLEMLRANAETFSKRMGLKQTPEIRVWRRGPSILGPAASFFFHKRFIIFDEDSLKRCDVETLDGILGHELAHIKKRHILSRFSLLGLMGTAANIASPVAWLTLPIVMCQAREMEFQADRLGAVVSGQPQKLAKFFRSLSNETLADRRRKFTGISIPSLAVRTAAATPFLMFYAMYTQHPDTNRRIERLETMGRPPKQYESDKLKSRFLEFLP